MPFWHSKEMTRGETDFYAPSIGINNAAVAKSDMQVENINQSVIGGMDNFL